MFEAEWSELQWDELDFMKCLEVEPKIDDEYKLRYIYKVEKDGLVLTVVTRPLEKYVWLSLQQKNSEFQLIEFAIFVYGKVSDKRGEYLRFENCFITPSNRSHLVADRSLKNRAPNWTVELSIKPHIQIRYLD